MMLHHDKHHRSYVEGLNKAEKMMEEARKTNQFDLIKHWERSCFSWIRSLLAHNILE